MVLVTLVVLFAGGCAARQPVTPSHPASAVPVTSAALPEPVMTDPETMAQDADAVCDLVVDPAQIVPRPAEHPDLHAHAVDDANRVLSAMNDDLLKCYKRRVKSSPNAHAFLTADILVGEDGHVSRVETTGGALLGDATMTCITRRIEKATFAAPYGGGTRHVVVPFNFRRVLPGEDP